MNNFEVQNETKQKSSTSTLLLIFIIISFIEGAVIAYLIINKNEKNQTVKRSVTSGVNFLSTPIPTQIQTPVPKSEKYKVNKDFYFPITSANGEILGEIKYTVKEYEFTNQVVINNLYKALVSGDKEILAIHIELTNENDAGVQIVAGDYIRFTKNNEEKPIAPDIESDPVEVRPHSVKDISLGFTISNKDQNLILYVGELNKEKETIKVIR